MGISDRLRGLAGVALLAAAGCAGPGVPAVYTAAAGGDGIGGTGIDAGGDGIGGTGIVGAITDLGSIRVNGLWIAVDGQTRVRLNARDAEPAQLRRGQVVEVLASGAPDRLRAIAVDGFHALAGPVASAAQGELRILGRRVRYDETTLLGEGVVAAPGRWLRISGFWDPAGSLYATRIDASAAGSYLLSGSIEGYVDGRPQLLGQSLVLGPATAPPPVGARVWARARPGPDGLQLAELQLRPARPFAGRARRLVLQGFAELAAEAGRLRLDGWDLSLQGGAAAARRLALDIDLSAARVDPLTLDLLTDAAGEVLVRDLDPVRPQSLDSPTRLVEPAPVRDRELSPDRPPPAAVGRPRRPDRDERPAAPQRPVRPDPLPAPDLRPAPIRDVTPVPEVDRRLEVPR